MVNEVIEARSEISRITQKLSRFGLLILDELGYVPFAKEGSQLLFQVIADCHERDSVIITSNLGFADWTSGDTNIQFTPLPVRLPRSPQFSHRNHTRGYAARRLSA
jgi:hypothetical protein